MLKRNKYILLQLIISVRLLAQSDTLIQYNPYSLEKQELVISYDTSLTVANDTSFIGTMGNRIDLELELPDSLNNSGFTQDLFAKDNFDMLSYPVRTNAAFLLDGHTVNFHAAGSGIMVSPNAILTAGHMIGREAISPDGPVFWWLDSMVFAPAYLNGNPQAEIGIVKAKTCYIYKDFAKSKGTNASLDLALVILDKPIGYKIGWIGLGYLPSPEFMLEEVFYNFSYPGMEPYDGKNMIFKRGKFVGIGYDFTLVHDNAWGIPGESGSGFFHTDNSKYNVYAVRTYTTTSTVITKQRFMVFKTLIDQNYVPPILPLDENDLFTVSPNPASDFINIHIFDNGLKYYTVTIFSLEGQKVFYEEGIRDEIIVDTRFKKGIYIVQVAGEERKQVKKLIVL